MEITEVSITPLEESRLKAYVNITFDEVFVIHGLRVIQGNHGMFVSMPARRLPDGSYKDIAHPITNAFRLKIQQVVLDAYKEIISENTLEKTEDQKQENVAVQ
ncbi:putative septation protein SpoVG [bacterium BMS3Abin05]|nr:putative septation protein SpoVG [bacterium BMS3Abin05]GBE26863.1 putative septation protein SpoVG [bacterium BMS3Bbin03]HDL78990.1 septation regulator SpoVG [Bacteroidota bacterium]HDZ10927.1 septation regulator SpoVG [Bacteroidota bacterium]